MPKPSIGGVRPKVVGLAGVLAQSGVVSAAFGRWPGFVLMITALVVVLVMALATVLIAAFGAAHFLG